MNIGKSTMKINEVDKKIVKEMTSAGNIATSMGGGNGFASGGPGTLKRVSTRKKKSKSKKA